MNDLITTSPAAIAPEIARPNYAKCVEQYKHFARKAAEDFIRLGKIVIYAERHLDDDELEAFCKEVRLPKKGPTYNKLKAIGEQANRFGPFMEQMPSRWTTLYKLAKLRDDEFDRVVNSGQFTPLMTANDVVSILGNGEVRQKPKRDLMIDLCNLPKAAKRKIVECIHALALEHGFVLQASEEVRKLLPSPEDPAFDAFLADLVAGNV